MTVEEFRRGFRARMTSSRSPGQVLLDEPGIIGLVGSSAAALDGRALVTDDRALATLTAHLPALHARVVNVFDEAEECRRLLSRTPGYREERCTAMVRGDLAGLPEPVLPLGLDLRPVGRLPGDGGVCLEEAAAAALASDPTVSPAIELDGFLAYLRAIPNSRYFAATDSDGVVRATSAAATFSDVAGVYFVNTDPAWRGRGVGTAMTAAALRAAAADGATGACLDASAIGLSIYLRLGFEPVGGATLFVREG